MIKVSMIGMPWVIGDKHNMSGGDVEVVGILDGFDAGIHGSEHHVVIIFRVVIARGVRDETSRCKNCVCGRVSGVEAVKRERESGIVFTS